MLLLLVYYVLCANASLWGLMFPIEQIFCAMTEDGLLFKRSTNSDTTTTPNRTTKPIYGLLCVAVLSSLFAGLFTIGHLIDLLSIGTLLAFIVIAIAIVMLRYVDFLVFSHSQNPLLLLKFEPTYRIFVGLYRAHTRFPQRFYLRHDISSLAENVYASLKYAGTLSHTPCENNGKAILNSSYRFSNQLEFGSISTVDIGELRQEHRKTVEKASFGQVVGQLCRYQSKNKPTKLSYRIVKVLLVLLSESITFLFLLIR